MRAKLIKKSGKCYIQLPDQMCVLDEVELFNLKDNFWLLSAPLSQPRQSEQVQKTESPQKAAKPANALDEPEIKVLRKLMAIRFADRTPSKIEKSFSAEEKNVVRQLIKRNVIQVFYGKQYSKTGVYNITNDIYPLLEHSERPAPAQPESQQSQPAPRSQASSRFSHPELFKNGWMVIASPREAEQFSLELKSAGLSMNVKGVRGFDGKFYVATNSFIVPALQKVHDALEKRKEMRLAEIAAECSLEPDAVMVVLRLMAEGGEVLEKKRDLFCLA